MIKEHAFDFAITTYCQARCRSCMRTNESTGEKVDWLKLEHMPLDKFKNILSNIETTKLHRLEFCGEFGDPIMHPDIEEFIDIGLQYVPYILIDTNGGLRQPDWYKHIATKYKNRVVINWGIDGIDHDTNWLYREGVDWKRAMDNMKAWFSSGGRGQWHFLIFEWNFHQIPEAYQMSKQIDCEIMFKMNGREFGLISDENRRTVYKLMENVDVM